MWRKLFLPFAVIMCHLAGCLAAKPSLAQSKGLDCDLRVLYSRYYKSRVFRAQNGNRKWDGSKFKLAPSLLSSGAHYRKRMFLFLDYGGRCGGRMCFSFATSSRLGCWECSLSWWKMSVYEIRRVISWDFYDWGFPECHDLAVLFHQKRTIADKQRVWLE